MAGVHYFLQEDRNKEVNFYQLLNTSGDIVTLRDIKKTFPVEGNFHFRFRTIVFESNPAMTVWMEVTDPDQPVPTFKGNIVAKALLLPPFTPAQAITRQRKVYKNIKSPHPQPSQSAPKLPPLRTEEVPHHKPSGSAASSHNQDFIDLRTPPKRATSAHAEFPSTSVSFAPKSHGPQVKSDAFVADTTKGLTAESLRAQKSAYVAESVNKKLEETRIATEKRNALVDAKLKVGRDLEERYKAWEERHGQKNNLRTLLTTLHSMLWEGAQWKQISPGDIVLPKQVKLQYFKALQVVHPDHHQNDGADIQFISERCYAALSEAWRRFQTETK